jgi:hypothetical protein
MEGMEPQNIQPKKKILIEFEDWDELIYYLFDIREKICPGSFISNQLKEMDKEEHYFHIQDTGKDSLPFVWRIREWKLANERELLLKKDQEEMRRRGAIIAELQEKLLQGVMKKVGGQKEDHTILVNCILMAKEKGILMAQELYNVDISKIKEL